MWNKIIVQTKFFSFLKLNHTAHIDILLLKDGRHFVGIENVYEFECVDGENPMYKCVLCKKDADSNNMIVHLNSHSHRENFLVRLKEIKNNSKLLRNWKF